MIINGDGAQMKYVLVIGDGMADYPVPELGNLTPLQVAHKPNMDAVAAKGRSGLLRTVPEGLPPGSDTAILSLLGYDPKRFSAGRGPLEAAAMGIELKENDVAFRCNLITEEEGILVDYSAGHISSNESSKLISTLKTVFKETDGLEFFPGLDYRHLLVLRNTPYSQFIECTPPHDAVGSKVADVLPRAKSEEAEKAVNLLRATIQQSRGVLKSHPVNVARREAGKRPGNLIWPWGGGTKPVMTSFKEKYGLNAAVVSAVDLVKGIGAYAGMKIISVSEATGLADTNYEGKADAVLKALVDNDFVIVHVEAPDEASHVKDTKLKVKTIEDLDKRLLGRIMRALKEPYVVAVLPDHPTPIQIGTHTRDPVPFAIQSSMVRADSIQKFDEVSAKDGAFGVVEKGNLVSLMLSAASSA